MELNNFLTISNQKNEKQFKIMYLNQIYNN